MIDAAKAKGRWTAVFVCNACNHQRRTVIGIVKHIIEIHPEGSSFSGKD